MIHFYFIHIKTEYHDNIRGFEQLKGSANILNFSLNDNVLLDS